MKHEHSNWPFIAIFLFIGFLYFTFEVVRPFAETQMQKDYLCEQKGGQILQLTGNEKICIQKSAIIEVGF